MCELDLNILKMYLHTKIEVFRSMLSTVRDQTDITEYITTPYMWVIKTTQSDSYCSVCRLCDDDGE